MKACMRAPWLPGLVVMLSVAAVAPRPAAAEEAASATVAVSARFSTRTSLKVSSQFLQFDLRPGDEAATGVVEFSAGARTYAGGEVVLTVEALEHVTGPEGAGAVAHSVTFAADGGNAGELRQSAPCIAARWIGSGLRNGRVTFTLRSSVAGSYSVPLRFVLSAP
jgi:hypothetical protein